MFRSGRRYAGGDEICDDAGVVDEGEEETRSRTERSETTKPSRGLPDVLRSGGHDRYEVTALLGRGGVGAVFVAEDRATGRRVALKTLDGSDEETLRRFEQEAEITAQLEHPAIVPLYDTGTLPDGRPFYTMRILARRSLRHLMTDARSSGDLSLAKKCAIVVQICRAVGFAHARGIVHRDLKPENVLVGDYGEVYVADWGVARRLHDAVERGAPNEEDPRGDLTVAGSVVGTPGYMAPEQWDTAMGPPTTRVDCFAIGVILYELLTGTRPFSGRTRLVSHRDAIRRAAVPPIEKDPSCPRALSDLCIALLNDGPALRPDAEAAARAIEGFLDTEADRELRAREAKRASEEGARLVDRYAELLAVAEEKAREARLLAGEVKPWDPPALKRTAWRAEDEVRALEAEVALALADAERSLHEALHLANDAAEPRRALARLYFERAKRARDARDEPARAYLESLVRAYDDGPLTARLDASSELVVHCEPSPCRLRYAPLSEEDRLLVPGPFAPMDASGGVVRAGSGLLEASHDGHRTALVPVSIRPGDRLPLAIRLFREGAFPPTMAHVPAGPFVAGGDASVADSLARQTIFVDDFAIDVFPVTFGQYCSFLDALEARDPREALRRLPSVKLGDGDLVRREGGRWVPWYERIIEGEAGRRSCPEHAVKDVPVLAVSWFDARAYADWRAAETSLPLRLPREIEWEKAARGTDGRWFPWGDRLDPTFCKMRDSRRGMAQPEPIGSFAADESPYGVRDLGGSMRDWVLDVADKEPNDTDVGEGADIVRITRGGAWNLAPEWCRSAARNPSYAKNRYATFGFRLAMDLGRGRRPDDKSNEEEPEQR